MTGLGAATLVLLALLPGALFVWSFERWAGRYGIGLPDRALRFAGGSAVFLSISAGPLYWLHANYWDDFAGRQVLTGMDVDHPHSLHSCSSGRRRCTGVRVEEQLVVGEVYRREG